jgi:hypothetical protein
MKISLIPRALIFILFLATLSGFSVQTAQAAECIKSSTFQNGYVYLAFKDTGPTCTWTVPSDASTIDYLLIGGGGSGGTRHGGGGGAGGLLKGTNISLTGITSLDIKIASGGAAVSRTSFNYATGLRGDTSTIVKSAGSGTFTSLAAVGGGGGEAGGQGAQSGGSGGGSQYGTPSTPVAGQGNSGGTGGTNSSEWWAGGGGGAGGVGANGTSIAGGAGGAGAIWIADFTTTIATALGLAQTNQTLSNQVYFAGGGGGSITTNTTQSNTAGGGGLGGGGAAALGNSTGTSGTANSGGGGGGSGCCDGGTTGAGGSGLALIRYAANAGLTLSLSNNPSFRVGTNIVATANIDGRVTFYANGKVIPNCKNKSTTSKSVTCVWRPSVHGRNSITATIVSSSYSAYTGVSASSAIVGKRAGSR